MPASLTSALESSLGNFLKIAKFETKVGLYFIGSAEMQAMNKEYRGKDKATDILSFTYGEEEEQIGDLALCLDVAEAQAKENGWDLQTECIRLLAHGFTHLLGYDHETEDEEKEMIEVEIKLLDCCGLKEIYPQG